MIQIVRIPRFLKGFLRSSKSCLCFTGVFSVLLCCAASNADTTLPYTQRSVGYSAYNNTVQGDLNTLGMAGATLGLVTSFNSSASNPAGLAMTLNGVSLEITGNTIYDGRMQWYDAGIDTVHYGLAANLYPWGFSLGYWTPQAEGQNYLANPSLTPTRLRVDTHELRASIARVFLEDKLSVGVGLVLGHHSQDSITNGSKSSQSIDAFSTTFGAMYQFPRRWILGVSFNPAIKYKVGHSVGADPVIPSFYQEAQSPDRLGIGLGWIPNRYFSFGFSVYWVGISPNAALLSDETQLVGYRQVLQPRVGASYTVAEFRELKIQAIAGTYYEFSRTQGIGDRLHGTASLKVDPWIFQVGWGLDFADKYRNFIYSFGIDLMKTMRKLDLVPKEKRRDYAGFLPRHDHYSDEGLARPLVENWNPRERDEDLLQVGLDIPKKLGEKIEATKEEFEKAFETTDGDKPAKAKKKLKKKKPPVAAKSAKGVKHSAPKKKLSANSKKKPAKGAKSPPKKKKPQSED
ncbi:hypothetical protein K2X30_10095 [bacterium]|nr:hypothetical protein [bacterium]